MSEWWSYRLSDFLLFSPRTYYRMIERLNEAVWPAHIILLALGCAVLVLVIRGRTPPPRATWTVLALAWAWVAWDFLWRRYAAINWAAVYVVPLFVLEAVLLLLSGWRAGNRRLLPASGRVVAAVLFGLATVGYPLVAPLVGRGWAQSEIFGLAPDPTAVATLSLLLLVPSRTPRLLMLVPAVWCLLSGLTLWAMGSPEAWIPPTAALLSVVARAGRRLGSPAAAGAAP